MSVVAGSVGFRPELLPGHTDGLVVTFHPSLPAHSQRLMASLGVLVRFDESAPAHCEAHAVDPDTGAAP